MRKKSNIVLLSFLLVFSLILSACNKSSGASGEGKGSSGEMVAIEEFAPKEDKKYKIDWAPYITDPVSQDAIMVKFYEDKFNVDFNIWNLDHQNIHEVLNLKFAAGEVPDYMGQGVEISNLPKLVQQGVLLEFDEEVIKKYMPNVYEKAIKLDPNWLNYAKVDGKIYGLPEMRTVSNYRTTIVWRGDWLKKVGITKTPETLEEFEEAFYKFAKEDPDGNGKNDTYGLSLSGIPAMATCLDTGLMTGRIGSGN